MLSFIWILDDKVVVLECLVVAPWSTLFRQSTPAEHKVGKQMQAQAPLYPYLNSEFVLNL